MDLVDLISEKRFFGQEFLTWLWWKSEERGGNIDLPGYGDIIVAFEKHMLLVFGEDEYSERLVCTGLQTELREARTGLRTGKKLEQARLRIVKGEYEWQVTIGATMFEYRSVRPPKTEVSVQDPRQSELAAEGQVLERIFLFEELLRTIDDVFRVYLDVRTADTWSDELAKLRTWVQQSFAEA